MPNHLELNTVQTWQSQAPANTMILGEHSVVYGHPALACAVDQFVHIKWLARFDDAINIYSSLGEHHTQRVKITPHPKLNFAVSALQAFQKQLPHGLDIFIESEFSSTIGLGSSAAVLAAMLSGLNHICDSQNDITSLFEIGHKIILDIQGRGSGTDLAASLAGGVIFFQPKNHQKTLPEIKKLDTLFPITLVYCGYKTPTAEVLKQVAKNWQHKTAELEMLYRSMAKITRSGFNALQSDELNLFYQACKDYQACMNELGVNDPTLQAIIEAMSNCASIFTCKISGSGLGDCVLGIGNLENCSSSADESLKMYQQLSVNITLNGASTHSL